MSNTEVVFLLIAVILALVCVAELYIGFGIKKHSVSRSLFKIFKYRNDIYDLRYGRLAYHTIWIGWLLAILLVILARTMK